MADPDPTPPSQAAANTPFGQAIEKFVVEQLVMILQLSLGAQMEFGGVVCADEANKLSQNQYQGDPSGADPLHVNVHQNEPRCGCAEGTRPVAWYHTHPFITHEIDGFGQSRLDWDKFSEGDLDVSEQWAIPGYVATADGSIWRYDPPPIALEEDGTPMIVNGKPVTQNVKGTYGVLKPKYIPILKGAVRLPPPELPHKPIRLPPRR